MIPALLRLTAVLCSAALVVPCAAQEKIVLDGSTGMIPLARSVVQAYQRQAPDAVVEIGQGMGTGARLKAVAEGRIQVALASHGILAADLAKDQLRAIDIAKGAIVFAVNSSVPLTGVTDAQVCDLFSGRSPNWEALGGPKAGVVVLTRPPAEVDPEVIRSKIDCFKDLKEVATAQVMPRGGDMAKGLADTAYAVGMTSMTVVEQSGGRIKALSLNGVAPTAENVKSGHYVLTRDFLFVVKAPPTPPVSRFLDFVQSPQGDAVIRASGAIPMR
jgi:phosphate transport system substrate-binding protein